MVFKESIDKCGEGDFCEVTESGVLMPGFETCLLVLSNTGLAYHLVAASRKILDDKPDFWDLLPINEDLSEVSIFFNDAYHNEDDYPGFDNINDLIHKLNYVIYQLEQINPDVKISVFGVKSNLLIEESAARVSSFAAHLAKYNGSLEINFYDESNNPLEIYEFSLLEV